MHCIVHSIKWILYRAYYQIAYSILPRFSYAIFVLFLILFNIQNYLRLNTDCMSKREISSNLNRQYQRYQRYYYLIGIVKVYYVLYMLIYGIYGVERTMI